MHSRADLNKASDWARWLLVQFGKDYRWLTFTFSNVDTKADGTYSFSGTGALYE